MTAICKNCTQRIPVPASSKSMESGKEAVQSTPTPANPTPCPESPTLQDTIQPTPAVPLPPSMPALIERFPEAPSIHKTSTAPPPEWAVERVKAMLALGETIPVIVERLVAKGLSAEAASTAIDRVLEAQVRPAMTRVRSAERFEAAHRWLSLTIAVGTVIFASFYFTEQFVVWTAIRVAIPVACIWFAEVLGSGLSYIHVFRSDVVRSLIVRLPAWIWLLTIVIRTIVFALIVSDA